MGSSVALSSSLLSRLALECGLLGQLATALALPPLGKFLGLHSSQAFPTDIIMERRTSRTSESLVPFEMTTKRGHGGQASSFLPPALASGEGIWRGCSFLKIREWATER